MKHLLALIGLTLLCAAWIQFQLWLKRVDPDKGDYQPGCGACQSSSCDQVGNTNESNKEVAVNLPVAASSKPPGQNGCKEER